MIHCVILMQPLILINLMMLVLTFVKYYGDVIPTTRFICRNIINGVIKSKDKMDFLLLMKSSIMG